jgi:hypothetical protein
MWKELEKKDANFLNNITIFCITGLPIFCLFFVWLYGSLSSIFILKFIIVIWVLIRLFYVFYKIKYFSVESFFGIVIFGALSLPLISLFFIFDLEMSYKKSINCMMTIDYPDWKELTRNLYKYNPRLFDQYRTDISYSFYEYLESSCKWWWDSWAEIETIMPRRLDNCLREERIKDLYSNIPYLYYSEGLWEYLKNVEDKVKACIYLNW